LEQKLPFLHHGAAVITSAVEIAHLDPRPRIAAAD
jgi:hypothetical protein